MSNIRRPLVMGAAVGYGLNEVRPFLSSLRRSGYAGDVLLLVDRALAAQLRGMDAFGPLHLLEAPRWLPFRFRWLRFRRTHPLRYALIAGSILLPLWLALRMARGWPTLQDWIAQYAVSPTELRYLRFLQFMRRHDYTHALISDVRDVVFQAEPFSRFPASGLSIGMEAARLTIATEPWNAWAMRLAYGRAGLARWGSQAVSCSGVTVGDRVSMLRYLGRMAREIRSLRFRATWQPLDQALHNAVVGSTSFSALHRLATLEGPIATLSGATAAEIRLDKAGRLLNRDGSVVAIAHQYDRIPGLAPVLLRSATGEG